MFPNIFQKFPKHTEDFEEDLKMFRSYTHKFKYILMVRHDINDNNDFVI